ncbi:hypothetical protein SNE40_017555 [Patella caerulea]
MLIVRITIDIHVLTSDGKKETVPRTSFEEDLNNKEFVAVKDLPSSKSVGELKEAIKIIEFPQVPTTQVSSFNGTSSKIDKASTPLIPVSDLPLVPNIGVENLFAVDILGDGNCLPRCASVILYGNQNRHPEMGERIVKELTEQGKIHVTIYLRLS